MVDFAILSIPFPNIGEDPIQQDLKPLPTHLITIKSYTTAVVPLLTFKNFLTDHLLKNKLVCAF